MSSSRRLRSMLLYAASILGVCLITWAAPVLFASPGETKADGPRNARRLPPPETGDAQAGRNVFRFETFGDEGFWTDAVRMPQGMKQAKLTPLQALKAGLTIDVEAIPADLLQSLSAELKTDLSPSRAPMLNDPRTTTMLVNANAVIGIVVKDSNDDGKLDVENGDKAGISCALCHTITDNSVYAMPHGGSIGHRIDGRTNHSLNVGKMLAVAANSRALYPTLQLDMGGKTIGRAPRGLTANSTEAEVDAYLSNPKYYPIGTFDDSPDGNGNSVHIAHFFRQDLAAPYGSSGQNNKLDDFNNTVCTALFDMTNLVTPGGRAFLKTLGGASGEKIANDYVKVLKATGVKGYPYVHGATTGKPGAAATPLGIRVDNQKLLDLNAYVVSLPAPAGVHTSRIAEARGRELFRANCTSCHNVDQSKPVPAQLIPMKTIFPGYNPTIIAKRKPPLTPIQNSPGTFDDKMIVVDASPGGGIRGDAMPLLLDLARKPVFLHDDSVHSLNELFNPIRGRTAPHPFYLRQAGQRADMIAFLKGLEIKAK